jgi:hypothetical protein
MFDWPTSSPKITRMLGFEPDCAVFSCAAGAAGAAGFAAAGAAGLAVFCARAGSVIGGMTSAQIAASATSAAPA